MRFTTAVLEVDRIVFATVERNRSLSDGRPACLDVEMRGLRTARLVSYVRRRNERNHGEVGILHDTLFCRVMGISAVIAILKDKLFVSRVLTVYFDSNVHTITIDQFSANDIRICIVCDY